MERRCSSKSGSFISMNAFTKFLQGVSVTGGDGVQRCAERVSDFLEGEFAPDLEDDDFPLVFREGPERVLDGDGAFCAVEIVGGEFKAGSAIAWDRCIGMIFAAEAPFIAAEKIQGDGANGGIEQWVVSAVGGLVFLPEADKSELHDVFGVVRGGKPLAGKEQKLGREFAITLSPGIVGMGGHVRFLFSGTPPGGEFVYEVWLSPDDSVGPQPRGSREDAKVGKCVRSARPRPDWAYPRLS